ncbi:hypothetical protein [Sinomonas mesophila]|uniref:hypothetical protein n=1 Tax=Sinomonas mesophila TaxID=1531955 RepID=UPI000985E59A|nr:hypothetical protein [Sinomonas mesophila]
MSIRAGSALARRLASFAATVGASTVVSLVTVPLIIGRTSAQAWGELAVVQTGAILFGVLVAFGWGTTGAATVAGTPAASRPRLYVESLVTRGYLFAFTLPVMIGVMLVVSPANPGVVVTGSIAYLLPYAGASWYFIGEARPARLFFFDALPQMIGVLMGFLVLNQTGDLTHFLLLLAVMTLVGVGVSGRVILRGLRPGDRVDLSLGAAWRRLAAQRHGVITAATTSLYVSLPLLAVSAAIPASTPLYAMGDKLFRFGLVAFSPVLQAIQSWVPEGGAEFITHRVRRAALFGPLFGLAGGAGITVASPRIADVLSHGEIRLSLLQALPFGLMFTVVACTQIIGLACLVAMNASKALAVSTVMGAVAGVPLIVGAALFLDVWSVAWAVVVSEVVVLAYQVKILSHRAAGRQGQGSLSRGHRPPRESAASGD